MSEKLASNIFYFIYFFFLDISRQLKIEMNNVYLTNIMRRFHSNFTLQHANFFIILGSTNSVLRYENTKRPSSIDMFFYNTVFFINWS